MKASANLNVWRKSSVRKGYSGYCRGLLLQTGIELIRISGSLNQMFSLRSLYLRIDRIRWCHSLLLLMKNILPNNIRSDISNFRTFLCKSAHVALIFKPLDRSVTRALPAAKIVSKHTYVATTPFLTFVIYQKHIKSPSLGARNIS